jgi:hypothetical protein
METDGATRTPPDGASLRERSEVAAGKRRRLRDVGRDAAAEVARLLREQPPRVIGAIAVRAHRRGSRVARRAQAAPGMPRARSVS